MASLQQNLTEIEAQLALIDVEVAYAKPEEQVIIRLRVPVGSTIAQAIEQSNILTRFSEIDWATIKVGIFSQVCKLDAVLKQNDRVEIYRPLLCDPMQARRDRAVQGL